ncbi:MAG: hypothetical protein HKN45_09700, partial [Flavobacteriales bacterium]|nr:hypothetical protein [Flavobacteriales bacterium]
VGAFRNPIPRTLFSEFDPIMGERLSSGIVRYKVGLFLDRNTASKAKNKIRDLGYSDAFVVRYVDGQRTGLNENTVDNPSPASIKKDEEEDDTFSSNSSSSVRNLEFDPENPTAYYDSYESAAPATQVEMVNGLFYTVQVGVFSKPVTSENIFDISPLNSDLMKNGLIKYSSGIFDDIAVAEQWKQSIRDKGVTDAFVTAYYNGERISLDRASSMLSNSGDGVLADLDEMDELHSDRQGQAVWEMVSTSELFAEEVRDQIQFKIRMGPYIEKIPDKDVKVILDFENNVEYGRREDGAIVYTTKGNMTYEEAQKWRQTFIESGITNANIIALQAGEEISVKQALDFLLK